MRHLNDLQVILDKRAYDKEIQSAQNIMENGAWYEKLIMNIISVPENVIGGSVAGITDILDIIKDGKLDNPYTVGHVWQDSASTVRSETAKSIDEEIDNEFLSAVATNTYQAVMSGADSAFGVAIMGKGYTLSASLSTFASRAKELYEMGATDAQVIVGAALDGVAEAFFEHFSIENLDAIKKAKLTGGIKGILKNALKQGGIEASEEFFTQIANQVSDSIVMAASSKNEQAIQQYIAQGMTRDEAEQQAAFDAFKEQLWAAYGGFVSGGMSAGGISIVNNAINKVTQNQAYAEIGQKIIDANAVNGFVATAIDLGKGTKSYNYANKFQSRDAKSAVKVGKLYDYTMTDLAEQSVNEMIDAQTVNSSNLIAIVTDRYMKTAFETRTGISLQGDTATQLNTARQAIESGEYKNSADNITENAENLPESGSNSTVNDTANTDVISEQEAEIDDYNGISVPDTTPVEENEFDELVRRMDGREAPLSEGQQYIRSVGKALGLTNVEFIDTTKGGITKVGNKFVATDDGFIDNDGTVYINSKASGSAALKVIFTHEISHFAEKNPGQYKKYAEAVFNSKTFEKWISEQKVDGEKIKGRSHPVRLGQYRDSIIKKYEKHGVSLESKKKTDGRSPVDREIIANFTSEMLFNEKNNTLERLVGEVNQKDRSAVFQFIHDFISWLKAVLKGEKISFDIVKLENHFASVLRNVETKSGQNKNTANDGGVEYTFAGENAATANKSLLSEAKKRTENGEDSETVRKETGWFRGYDGKWRYEIDDSKMTITKSDKDYLQKTSSTLLGYLIKHDELFEAYPQLKDVMVYVEDGEGDGDAYYNPKYKTITLNSNALSSLNDNGLKGILIHEIQHAIQDIEGFTSGTDTSDFAKYLNTAGEIEAYDVGDRINLTAEQRKNTRPDIDRTDVVFASNGSHWLSAKEAQYDPETASVSKQIKNSQDVLNRMNIVGSAVAPENFKTKYEAAQWAISQLKATGYQVDRQNFGKIYFEENDIRKGAEYADTYEEKAAFLLIPKVLKRGIEIGRHGNHKLRQKATVTFAVPVMLNGIRGNMAVVVNLNSNRYKVHRIILPDGTTFKFSTKKEVKQESYQGVTENSSLADTTSFTSNSRISQTNATVNNNISEESENYSSPEQNNDGNSYSFGDIDVYDEAQYNFGVSQNESRRVAIDDDNYRLKVLRGESVTDILEAKAKEKGYSKDDDWKMDHRAPNANDGYSKSIDNIDAMYGSDGSIYSPKAVYYYGEGRVYDSKAIAVIKSAKDNPEKLIKIYRAVPTSIKDTRIRNGDWVAIVKEYAEEHGSRVLDDDYRIIENTVPAKFLYGNGDSINEWGYDNGNENEVYKNTANNVKTIEVTYDDSGDVIPLSERFNEDNNDIRYSFEDDVVDKTSSLTEQYKNGEISYDEWKSQAASLIGDNNTNKADNPVSIANLSVEAANPTPDLPKRNRSNKKGDGDSKLAESIQKSDIFSKEFKDEVVDDDFIKHYDRATNKETMAKAKKLLDEGGSSFVLQWFNKSIDETSTVDVAAGIIMLDRYQKIGDMANALEVAYKLREMATISGQTVQIFSILGRFTPEMMLVYAQHELDKAYETIIKGKTNKWIESNRSKFELTEAEKEFIIRNTLVAATLPEGRDKRIKLAEIASLVQKKTPHKPGDAYKALQRISMLLNPKTNDRNIVGNAIMTPICWIDDLWGACIDNLASKKSGVRTTGNFQFGKEMAKAFAQGVYESYDDFIRDINTREINLENSSLGSGNNFNENHTGKVSKYVNPISKSLNALDRITSFILDAGDRGFFQMWFINSLNNQLRLNNTTEPTAEMIEIATNDALERTWQDSDNKIVQMFSRFKNALNHISVRGVGLGDWYMKFVKTNANLLRAAIKYSPAGFGKAIYDFVKFNRSLKNGQFDAKIQRKFVNNLSKGITGILLYTIFGFLARAGVISGREDDDKDVAAFEKNVLGIQPYSVKIGDYSFSYTWISPLDSGMAFMADFMDTWENGDSSTFFDKVLEATKSGGQTILDKSVFQSIQNLFKEDDYVSVIVDGILNEVVVFAPQTLSQAASVADDYSRETYEKGDTIKTAINSVKRKIPGLRNTLPESVDVYGEAVENPYDNVWDAFFNPANQLQSNSSPSAEKIYELYQNTKEKSIIPPKAVNKITINGEDITFTSEERTAFQKYRGQLNAKYLDDFTSSSLWEKSSDEEKISIIKDIYSFTNSLAKNHYSSEYELSKKEQKILEYEDFGIMSPIEYFSITTTADKDGNSYVSKSEYAEAVNHTDMSQQQKDLLIGLNDVEGKSDYSKNKTKGFGTGDWYYKKNGQYVKITSAAELNQLRRNNVDTYVYTGNYTDVIDELWKAYRGY